jgi:hypothetical protein
MHNPCIIATKTEAKKRLRKQRERDRTRGISRGGDKVAAHRAAMNEILPVREPGSLYTIL